MKITISDSYVAYSAIVPNGDLLSIQTVYACISRALDLKPLAKDEPETEAIKRRLR